MHSARTSNQPMMLSHRICVRKRQSSKSRTRRKSKTRELAPRPRSTQVQHHQEHTNEIYSSLHSGQGLYLKATEIVIDAKANSSTSRHCNQPISATSHRLTKGCSREPKQRLMCHNFHVLSWSRALFSRISRNYVIIQKWQI